MSQQNPPTETPSRVAVVTDVHGNLPALEAILADIDRRRIGTVLCCGDIVGYGPWPNEVIEILERRGISCLRGNVDRDALRFHETWRRLKRKRHPDKFRSLAFTAACLSPSSRAFLEKLPETRDVDIAGKKVVMVHGSPDGIRDPILADAPAATLARHLRKTHADVLLCGHTHLPFARHCGRKLVVNAGTGGRPVDGDPRASYALLDLGGKPVAEIVRVAYDVERVARAAVESELPESFPEMYRTGVNPWREGTEGEAASGPEVLAPTDPLLRSILAWRDDLTDAVRRAGEDDPEGIHDVRVATRRLRAALRLLEPRAEAPGAGKKVRRARKLLGRLARSLSAPRSAQVHYAILDGYKKKARKEARCFLEGIVVARGAALSDTLARVKEEIARFPTEKLVRVLTEAVALASVALSPEPAATADDARGRVREAAALAQAQPTEAHYHELRIEVKKLRYSLEASGLTGSAEHAAAKEAQGILGDVHDRDEILSWLDGERRRAARLRAMRHARHCQELGAEIERERAAILATLDLDALLHAPADEAEERPA